MSSGWSRNTQRTECEFGWSLYTSSMTSWSLLSLMFFFVFQGSIDMSVGNCVNHLQDKNWMEDSEKQVRMIDLVTHNREHTVDCSLEREWNKTNNIVLRHILNECFYRDIISHHCSDSQESVVSVSPSNFNCMIAKAKNLTNKVKECEHLETVCKFILEPTWTVTSKQLTTPLHALRTTTTTTTTTTSTTATTATLLTSPTNSTDNEIHQHNNGSKEQHSGRAPECRQQQASDVPVLVCILVISLVLNVFLLLAFYFYTRQTRKCDCRHKLTDTEKYTANSSMLQPNDETVSINQTPSSCRTEDYYLTKEPRLQNF